MSNEKSGDKPKYLHKVETTEASGDSVVVHEENIIHGRGLSFKYYHKEAGKIEKIVGRQNADGTYSVKTTKGDKTEEKTLSKEELVKEFGKAKHLKFAVDYIKQSGGRRGSRKMTGGSRRSRRGSKRGSKRTSRKGSRKHSRKMTGGSRRRSRMGSKRGSRKGSRRH